MSGVLPWAVLIPLFGALLAAAAPTLTRWTVTAVALGTTCVALRVGWEVAQGGPLSHAVGGFEAPLGIVLRADGFSAQMLSMTALVGGAVSLYALEAQPTSSIRGARFQLAWLFGWSALNALFVSGDVFNLYVTLELTTLSSVVLIALSGTRAALLSGVRYGLFALLGAIFYLLGVALLYAETSTLDLHLLAQRIGEGPVVWVAFGLMAVGLSLKSGLFPLHVWAPPAYGNALPPGSALLSGLLSKASLYVLLRLWFAVFPGALRDSAGALLSACGSAGVIWGAVLAMRQRRLSMLIAYSSVSQMGFLFLTLGLTAPSAFSGTLFLILSHALAKAAMFLAAASIVRCLRSDQVTHMQGLARKLPLTFAALGIAGTSLMGLPPSAGFIAKWLLLRASMEAHQWGFAAMILVSGLFTAGYLWRLFYGAFLPLPPGRTFEAVPRAGQVLALLLASLAAIVGIFPQLVRPLATLEGAP